MPEVDPRREAREALRRELEAAHPPADLEDRVLRELHAEGLLGDPGARPRAGWMRAAVAASILLATGLLAGFLLWGRPAGDAVSATAAAEADLYILLLRKSGSAFVPSAETEALVAEYRDWARRQAERDLLLGGEKLADSGLVLAPAESLEWRPGHGSLVGYFLVHATSYDEAAVIARTCPHLRHGGTIEIRKIDPT